MKHPLTPESLLELRFVSDPQLAPGALQAAAVVTEIVSRRDSGPPHYRHAITLYDLSYRTESTLAQGVSGHAHARFSPNGELLAFLASDSTADRPNLWVHSLKSGRSRQLTDFRAGVNEFAWHPTGRSIALVSRGHWEDQADQARIIDRLHYKLDGAGFRPTEPAQIYLYDFETAMNTCLSTIVADASNIAFNPDGAVLYFTASPTLEDDNEWLRQIYALTLRDGSLRPLLNEARTASHLSVSPEGCQVAFLAPPEPRNFANLSGLWLLSTRGGRPRLLSTEFNGAHSIRGDARYGSHPNTPQWLDEATLVINRNYADGNAGLARINLRSGRVTPLQTGQRVVSGFTLSDGTAAFIGETPTTPGELFVRTPDGNERQVSHVNAGFVAKYNLRKPNPQVATATPDGVSLRYWLLEPALPRTDHAMVLQVHAGAQTVFGYGFFHEFQLLAARGYAVVYGNPRDTGSPRNSLEPGQDLAAAMRARYTEVYPNDTLAIVDHALANHADPKAPVHITGGSNGGYMTNWLVSQTNRFRSAVAQRSIANLLSKYGASDIGFRYTKLEHGGNPWQDFEQLWCQSPLKYVENVTTPILILHAEEDQRCPMSQAEEWYVALKQLGNVDVRLVLFPGEGHEMSRSGRPDRRVERLRQITSWFEEHP